MRRLQIYIPEETYQELRKEAFEKNTSIAQVVRKKVSKKTKKKVMQRVAENPFAGLIKLAKHAEKEGWKGPRDLASRVDYYLYGEGAPK